MTFKSALTVRIFANRFHKGPLEPLLHFLPEGEGEEVRNIEVDASDVAALVASPLEQIEGIDYSWFAPIIQKLPAKAHAPLIRALPLAQAKRLSQSLNIPLPSRPLDIVTQRFLVSQLLKKVPGFGEALPLSFLPTTTLSPLGSFGKTSLIDLIRFLGIHDLAEEIRHVVDNRRIKSLYQCLTPQEQQYLKYCMHLKEKFIALSLGLDKWEGDCEKLKITLQARGLIRLGKALSGEHPDLVWHIAHLFDSGRGQTLLKHYSKKGVPAITPALAAQVVNLIGILKKKESA